MKTLTTFEQLKKLKFATDFYVIKAGRMTHYIHAGLSPVNKNITIATLNYDYKSAVCFDKNDFFYGVFMTGKYDSEIIGKIMINQYNTQITMIEKIYLKMHQ